MDERINKLKSKNITAVQDYVKNKASESRKTTEEVIKSIGAELPIKKPRYTVKDIILSDLLLEQINEAIVKIDYYSTIYKEWGFEKVDPEGKGIIINFSGPPGTGKTRTAEAFAGTIKKDIIQISLSDIESKFMGETAKNITNMFKVAKELNAVIFIDEADTLLGKRLSSVTQGIDNEVNTMRSTLLIELENHDGIVIFATNFKKNYDSAFLSRISHQIEFKLPELAEREKLFDMMLVTNIPLAENRTDLISKAAVASEGFAGRDIRSVMRLALPKVVSDRLKNPDSGLCWVHLSDSIELIRQNIESGKRVVVDPLSDAEIDAAKGLIGIK